MSTASTSTESTTAVTSTTSSTTTTTTIPSAMGSNLLDGGKKYYTLCELFQYKCSKPLNENVATSVISQTKNLLI